jgi:hypothetical protein
VPVRGAVTGAARLNVLHAACNDENVRDCVLKVVAVMGRREVKSVRRSGRSIVRGSIMRGCRISC